MSLVIARMGCNASAGVAAVSCLSGVVNALTNGNCGNYYTSLPKLEIVKCLRARAKCNFFENRK